MPGRARAFGSRATGLLIAAALIVAALAAGSAGLGPVAPAQAASIGTTVAGPTKGSSVTVSQTVNLVNQVVHVSWKGFRPSEPQQLDSGTTYPVKVYQCTADPKGPEDCYGSSVYANGPGQGTNLPDGPSNAIATITNRDGTGSVDIEVRTKKESSTLACASANPCSLVVVPNYGKGDGLDFLFATLGLIDADYAWKNHVTVPLQFAKAADSCPLKTADVTTSGSPAFQRQIVQWQPKTCVLPAPTAVDYTALGEPQARTSFLSGQSDVALTTLPATDVEKAGATRTYSYAPIGLSGMAIAYRIDDADTQQPITDMKLTPRLVAKLVTESYTYNGLDNPATKGNPNSIFDDPEFLALNPGHAWPGSGSTPLILGDASDMTYEITRWMESDPATKKWLAGAKDEHGVHVNTNYKGIDYPTQTFDLRDGYEPFTYIFAPFSGLVTVARSLVLNQAAGASPVANPQTGAHDKPTPEIIGNRDLIAVVSLADATAYRFNVASIPNGAGKFVQPTDAGLTAAYAQMTVDKATGTRSADFAGKSPTAYPLTMLEYAMVPTSGLKAATANKLSLFLNFAAGAGQAPGVAPGQLAPGVVPLPAAMRTATTQIAAHVKAQDGKPAGTQPNGKPSPSPRPSATPTGDSPRTDSPNPDSPNTDNPSTDNPQTGGDGTITSADGGDTSNNGSGGDTGDGTDGSTNGSATPTPRPSAAALGGGNSPTGTASGASTVGTSALIRPVAARKTSTENLLLVLLILGLVAMLLGPGYLLWGRRAAFAPVSDRLRAVWAWLIPSRRDE
jgi:hypothetical protein